MDWMPFKPLLVEQAQKQIKLSIKSQTAAQPPEVQKVIACLEDGSIDPGDLEQVSRGLLGIVMAMPEYQAVVDFSRERRRDYAAMFAALARASDAEYEAYVELTQQVAAEMVTEALFGMLVTAGVLKDLRGN
jgi:hypothetical protein